MRIRALVTLLGSLGLLFLLMPAAQADQVQLYFTGNTSGGIYDPYEFYITSIGTSNLQQGLPTWLNCDDYNDHVGGGESWVADVIYGSDTTGLASTRMSQLATTTYQAIDPNYNAAIAYDEKAWLEEHYSAANNPDYSDAIWDIWENVDRSTNTLYAAAITAVQGDSAGNYDTWRQSLTVYTPDSGCSAANACGSKTSGWTDGVPQEFDRVPDGGVTLMLLGGALVGLETLRRKLRA